MGSLTSFFLGVFILNEPALLGQWSEYSNDLLKLKPLTAALFGTGVNLHFSSVNFKLRIRSENNLRTSLTPVHIKKKTPVNQVFRGRNQPSQALALTAYPLMITISLT